MVWLENSPTETYAPTVNRFITHVEDIYNITNSIKNTNVQNIALNLNFLNSIMLKTVESQADSVIRHNTMHTQQNVMIENKLLQDTRVEKSVNNFTKVNNLSNSKDSVFNVTNIKNISEITSLTARQVIALSQDTVKQISKLYSANLHQQRVALSPLLVEGVEMVFQQHQTEEGTVNNVINNAVDKVSEINNIVDKASEASRTKIIAQEPVHKTVINNTDIASKIVETVREIGYAPATRNGNTTGEAQPTRVTAQYGETTTVVNERPRRHYKNSTVITEQSTEKAKIIYSDAGRQVIDSATRHDTKSGEPTTNIVTVQHQHTNSLNPHKTINTQSTDTKIIIADRKDEVWHENTLFTVGTLKELSKAVKQDIGNNTDDRNVYESSSLELTNNIAIVNSQIINTTDEIIKLHNNYNNAAYNVDTDISTLKQENTKIINDLGTDKFSESNGANISYSIDSKLDFNTTNNQSNIFKLQNLKNNNIEQGFKSITQTTVISNSANQIIYSHDVNNRLIVNNVMSGVNSTTQIANNFQGIRLNSSSQQINFLNSRTGSAGASVAMDVANMVHKQSTAEQVSQPESLNEPDDIVTIKKTKKINTVTENKTVENIRQNNAEQTAFNTTNARTASDAINENIPINRIVDKVYKQLETRLRNERQRRGMN